MIQFKTVQKDVFTDSLPKDIYESDMDSFFHFKGKSIHLDCFKTAFPLTSSTLYASEFNTEQRFFSKNGKEKPSKIGFPIISFSIPYFFASAKFCVMAVNYNSSFTTGYYGYYLFEFEKEWKFKKVISESLK